MLRNAIISAEDGDFFNHVGINIPRIIITLASNILKGDLTDAGASTLTMQLARNVRLRGESLGLQKTWQRKLLEAYYTFHIEEHYTKREILTLYANQMWLGTASQSAYGVEAASRLYFGKPARDVDLGEAAMIAGIFQSPARQSPLVSLDLARSRRNYALQRMADEGYITQARGRRNKGGTDRAGGTHGPQQLHRALLHRGGAKAPQKGVWRGATVRRGPDGPHHAGCPASESCQPGDPRWIAGP